MYTYIHIYNTHAHFDVIVECILLLLFRGHTYQFDDFLASWMDRLKDGLDGEHTTVTIRLQKEVDKYQVSLYLSSYIRTCTYDSQPLVI